MSPDVPTRRMTRDERREQILDAATAVFAEGGYAGTSTDQVARAANVSQPYVVRLFGTKEELFREVFDRIATEVLARFEAVRPGPDAKAAMVEAYTRLVADPDQLRVLMHGFVLGSDPVLGSRGREVLARSFDLYRARTGASDVEARDFVAQGMLLNTLFALQADAHADDDPSLAMLVRCTIDPSAALRRVATEQAR
ncbi:MULTISPECIES: TetR/AcrR family transcriptional regulator [Cellulosimicrobium]|uniref:Helix-turn-helix domain-containing protein n=1 Tax=Cellulosimicrobium sp. ES-005 TaxID=3163031 RepID=A0AAU8FWB7_9MICO|nr:TetR/AcrR family transcriptional regulator [Cellulosimicrobium cellulans]MCO7273100.1 TetR/AcrR family transcriptional regulator [Cellulosimicrobium cellulans]